MRYFRATVQLGHMGAGNDRPVSLFIYAKTMSDAIEIAKKTPGVKHGKLPLEIVEITKSEFEKDREIDPYLQAMDQLNHGVSL